MNFLSCRDLFSGVGYIEEFIPCCFIFDAFLFHLIHIDSYYASDAVMYKDLKFFYESCMKCPDLTSLKE